METNAKHVMLGLHRIIEESDDSELKKEGQKMIDLLFEKFPNALPSASSESR